MTAVQPGSAELNGPVIQQASSSPRRVPGGLWILAVLTPFAVLSRLVQVHGIRFPYWDEWDFVPLVEKMRSGTLGFHDVWAQHNEHRILFPNLLMLGLARLSRWDLAWELRASLLLALGSVGGLVLLIRRTFAGRGQWVAFAIVLIVAWYLFSPVQSENWLWPFQVEWFLSVLGVVGVLVALSPENDLTWIRLVLGIASGVLACYSLGDGQLVWVTGAIVMLIAGRTASKVLTWSAVGSGFWALYYWGYSNAGQLPHDGYKQPLRLMEYVLMYLGGSLVRTTSGAEVMGLLLSVVFIGGVVSLVACPPSQRVAISPWVGLGLYVGATAFISGLSRLSLGLGQALTSRYTSISSLFVIATVVIGLFALLAYLPTQGPKRRMTLEGVVGAIAILSLFVAMTYAQGISAMRGLDAHVAGLQQCLQAAEPGEVDCPRAFPDQNVLDRRLEYLKSIGWGGFHPG